MEKTEKVLMSFARFHFNDKSTRASDCACHHLLERRAQARSEENIEASASAAGSFNLWARLHSIAAPFLIGLMIYIRTGYLNPSSEA